MYTFLNIDPFNICTHYGIKLTNILNRFSTVVICLYKVTEDCLYEAASDVPRSSWEDRDQTKLPPFEIFPGGRGKIWGSVGVKLSHKSMLRFRADIRNFR